MATGEPGWQHPGCGRHGGKRRGLWASGRQSRRQCFPQIRFVSLLENGTHVLWAARMEQYADRRDHVGSRTSCPRCAKACCAWQTGSSPASNYGRRGRTGADLLWRMRQNVRLAVDQRLPDGSYLSRIYRFRLGLPASAQRDRGAGDRLSPGRTSQAPSRSIGWSPPSSIPTRLQPENWRPSIMSAGRSKPRSTNSRPICAAPRSCCAAKRRIWCARSSTAS